MTVDRPSSGSDLPEKTPEKPEQPMQLRPAPLITPAILAAEVSETVDRIFREEEEKKQEREAAAEGIPPFNLRDFELLERATYRELTPEDLPLVGALYRNLEMDTDIFYEMSNRQYADADLGASQGGMIHPWEPNAREKRVLRKICPQYISCADEFRSFLEGTHGRSADFRAWGMFAEGGEELLATASCFLPPYRDPAKLRRYADELRGFFKRKISRRKIFLPDPQTAIGEIFRRAKTTAEFYMIATKKRGAASLVIQKMLDQLLQEGIPLTDMYLLRFGSMKMVYPHDDKRPAHDAPNMPSRRFFMRRGFRDCAQYVNKRERACRETRGGIVGVEPKWTVMHASFADLVAENRSEVAHLEARAKEAREGPAVEDEPVQGE